MLALGGLVIKEMLVGFGFAFALAALFAAVQVAGSLLDTLIGFCSARSSTPSPAPTAACSTSSTR